MGAALVYGLCNNVIPARHAHGDCGLDAYPADTQRICRCATGWRAFADGWGLSIFVALGCAACGRICSNCSSAFFVGRRNDPPLRPIADHLFARHLLERASLRVSLVGVWTGQGFLRRRHFCRSNDGRAPCHNPFWRGIVRSAPRAACHEGLCRVQTGGQLAAYVYTLWRSPWQGASARHFNAGGYVSDGSSLLDLVHQ